MKQVEQTLRLLITASDKYDNNTAEHSASPSFWHFLSQYSNMIKFVFPIQMFGLSNWKSQPFLDEFMHSLANNWPAN